MTAPHSSWDTKLSCVVHSVVATARGHCRNIFVLVSSGRRGPRHPRHSHSGAVRASRGGCPSWAVHPNEPSGFRGRKASWTMLRHWSQLVPNIISVNEPTSEDITEATRPTYGILGLTSAVVRGLERAGRAFRSCVKVEAVAVLGSRPYI